MQTEFCEYPFADVPVETKTSQEAKAPAVVGLQKASSYDSETVLEAMRACLDPLGGMKSFVRPGQRVLLKPNLLGPFPPERAVTTHPAVVRATLILVKETGGIPFLGESPGMTDLITAVRVCGLKPALEETGTRLVDFSEAHSFEVPNHKIAPKLLLAKVLQDVDVVISLCKLKTHAQMTFTGALKNQFGFVPGTLKGQWHFRLQDPRWLASLILDVNRVVRPALTIMDGIMAMEGHGPSGGNPRFLGALLAGSDPAAVDRIACQMIQLDPMSVPLLKAAREQEFGQTYVEKIQVAGIRWEELQVNDFVKIHDPISPLRLLPLPWPALQWVRKQWTLRPRIIEERCTECGICEKGCPVTPAVIHPTWARNKVEIKRCIRCYCCHEFCPSKAIELQKPWLMRHLPLETVGKAATRVLGALFRLRSRFKARGNVCR